MLYFVSQLNTHHKESSSSARALLAKQRELEAAVEQRDREMKAALEQRDREMKERMDQMTQNMQQYGMAIWNYMQVTISDFHCGRLILSSFRNKTNFMCS